MKKKKTIKINFKFFWPGFDSENNFLIYFLKKKYNVIISEEPDYLFYAVYNTNPPPKNIEVIGKIIKRFSPEAYLYLRRLFSRVYHFFSKKGKIKNEGSFVKIFFGTENIKPNMDECDWAFGSHFEEEINHPKYFRIPHYRLTNYKGGEKGKFLENKKIDFKKIKKEKTKFCNFIYSQDISLRNNFFKRLSKYKKIDAPGRCMNNMFSIGEYDSPKKSRMSQDWIKEKLNFLNQYKFTIAFENSFESGGVSEKITHPMLVNSIPIYFGHKDIEKDFNTKSFINYSDFDNMEDFIKRIIKVDNDDKLYEEYLKQPWYKNNESSKDIYFSDKKLLKRFEEIFG